MDILVRNHGWVKSNQPVHRCSLGIQLTILEKLARAIEADETHPVALDLKTVYRIERVSTRDFPLLTAERNRIIHPRDSGSLPGISQQALVQHGRGFLETTRAFFEMLLGADELERTFPFVVQVVGVRIDRWGRKLYEAQQKNERIETIVTNDPLQPGRVYYMHPRSNPVRVDPILVPGMSVDATQAAEG